MNEGMVTTGSKLLIGATVVALISAIAYGVLLEGTLGVIGLISATVVLALFAGISVFTRDGDVDPDDETAVAASVAAEPLSSPSVWPLFVGIGGGMIVLGVISEPVVFMLGTVVLLAALAEWLVGAWSDRAPGDTAHAREARARMAGPLEFPVLGVVIGVIVIFSFSRIMLFLSKEGGVVAFAVIGAVVLLAGFVIAYQPRLGSAAIGSLCVLGAAALVAGGVATGLEGERDIEAHETTGTLATESHCDTADETHADDNASQSVAAKANTMGTIVLTEDERLIADVPARNGEQQQLVIPQGTNSNVLFENKSGADRRLMLELGTTAAVDEEGNEIEGEEEQPVQLCTALVEEDGMQLLTFRPARRSSASDSPYRFTVPGVDGQEVELVVP